MSLSARRLSSGVLTNRFAWQGEPVPPAVPVEPFLRSRPDDRPPATPAPAMRDLPSPSAERLAAAEREGYARGYGDGERVAGQAAAEQYSAVSANLAVAIADLAAVRGTLMRRSEQDLVRLAVAMAERVLRREVDVDRELLVVMARVAIERLGESAVAAIHLNPLDYEVILARHSPPSGSSVELVADESVARGGCRVKSSFGTIDTGIEPQIAELTRALLGEDTDAHEEEDDGPVRDA